MDRYLILYETPSPKRGRTRVVRETFDTDNPAAVTSRVIELMNEGHPKPEVWRKVVVDLDGIRTYEMPPAFEKLSELVQAQKGAVMNKLGRLAEDDNEPLR